MLERGVFKIRDSIEHTKHSIPNKQVNQQEGILIHGIQQTNKDTFNLGNYINSSSQGCSRIHDSVQPTDQYNARRRNISMY